MTTPYRLGQALGWTGAISGGNGTNNLQLSAAATWWAVSFVPDASRTLSAVRAYVSAVAGTLAGSDVTCDLYDSAGTSGAPGAAIESGKLPSATITAAGWYDFTGFTTVLAANQEYWAVFKNVNGVPATNRPTFQALSLMRSSYLYGANTNRLAWAMATSSNSGSTWSRSADASATRVSYADGTYDGIPLRDAITSVIGDGVYATRESGMKFTSPSNATLNVRGLAMMIGGKTGSPTGSPRLGLWTGSSPANQAYATFLTTTVSGAQWLYGYFASNIVIQPGTICRITLGETTQSDASSARFSNYEMLGDTDSNSTPLLPWNGTATKTYFDGSSWTDSALGTSLMGHALLLDTAGEFGASAGTSGGFIIGG